MPMTESGLPSVPLHSPLMPEGVWPDLADPRHRQFVQHWAEQRAANPGGWGLIAPRSAIDPMALRACLPHLWIYRWDTARQDFICTLAGEAVNQAWGFSIIGRTTYEVMGAGNGPLVRARYLAVLGIPAIQCSRKPIEPHDGIHKRSTRIILPLCDGEGAPYGVLGMTLYDYDPYREADKPVQTVPEVELYGCAGLPRTPPA